MPISKCFMNFPFCNEMQNKINKIEIDFPLTVKEINVFIIANV